MSWAHLRDNTRKARKQHRCYLCNESIVIGEQYIDRVGTDNGEIIAMKMHMECERETKVWDDMDWECFFQGDMERPTTPKTIENLVHKLTDKPKIIDDIHEGLKEDICE